MTAYPLVSICIPTYHEEGYLRKTLKNLFQQYLIDKSEVVIADYDPQNEGLTKKVCNEFKVRYVRVHGSGIAHARNVGVRSSLGRYIMNFDADCTFSRRDAMDFLVNPLKDHQCIATHPDYVVEGLENANPMKYIAAIATVSERFLPVARCAGLTIERRAFDSIGGFRDMVSAEDYAICLDLMYRFGLESVKWISQVSVIGSPRRFENFNRDLVGIFDYKKAYRNGQKVNT